MWLELIRCWPRFKDVAASSADFRGQMFIPIKYWGQLSSFGSGPVYAAGRLLQAYDLLISTFSHDVQSKKKKFTSELVVVDLVIVRVWFFEAMF